MRWEENGYNCDKPIEWKGPGWKPKFGPNGDFDYIESTHSQDFKYHPIAEIYRGIFHPETSRTEIYYGRHESFEDITKTCTHEALHSAFSSIIDGISDGVVMDIDQEHRVIQILQWMLTGEEEPMNTEICGIKQ